MPPWAQWVSLATEISILFAISTEIILSVLDRKTQAKRDKIMQDMVESLENSSAELADIADVAAEEK